MKTVLSRNHSITRLFTLILLAGWWVLQPIDQSLALGATTQSVGSNGWIHFLSQIGGSVRAVAIQGNYAYIGAGPRLEVLDISDPSHPFEVGKTALLPDSVENMVVSGDFAYVAANTAGLRILNIADPANPIEVGADTTPKLAYGITQSGTYIFVTDPMSGTLWGYDVSDPSHPQMTWSQSGPGGTDVLVVGNYLYAAMGNLEIFDISTVDQPNHIATLPNDVYSGNMLYSIAVSGSYLYEFTRNADLWIVDISNPALPVKRGLFSLHYGYDLYNDIAVANGFAYLIHYSGMYIVDVSNPDLPIQAGSIKTTFLPSRLALLNDQAYIADLACLRVVQISNPASPIEIGAFEPGGFAASLSLIGNYAYLSGLVIDTTTPTAPQVVGKYSDSHSDKIKAYSAQIAYTISSGTMGVIDVSNLAAPITIKQIPAGSINDIAFQGHYLFATDFSKAKLLVYDLSDPQTPVQIGSLSLPDYPRDILVLGSYAYILNSKEVDIVDITDPTRPVKAKIIPSQIYLSAIAASGSNLVIGEGNSGVSIYAVSNPLLPQKIGTFTTPGYVSGIATQGTVAFIADKSAVMIVDIQDPANPQVMDTYPMIANDSIVPEGAFQVSIQDDVLYVSNQGAGLYLFQQDILPVTNPTPVITGLSPASGSVGSAAFSLTVNGTGFVDHAVVKWGSTVLNTTFVNATQVTASVPTAVMADIGSVILTITNPSPNGRTSNGLSFSLVNPTPNLTNLSPNNKPVASPAFTLTVNGTGFVNSSVVKWGSSALSTTFVSANQLSASVPDSVLIETRTVVVSVENPAPGGGTSPGLDFTVANPAPHLSSLNPAQVFRFAPGFTLWINGDSFVPGAVVRWNGTPLATSYISTTQLSATVLASLLHTTGTLDITVENPAPNAGESNSLPVAIRSRVFLPLLNQ